MPTTSRRTRVASKRNASIAKARGAGSSATQTKETTSKGLIGGLLGAATGFVTGGPAGAVAGGIAGLTGGGGGRQPPAPPPIAGLQAGPADCPRGTIMFRGTCISPGDLGPGGPPATFPVSGTKVSGGCPEGAPRATTVGSFGLPAAEPCVETRIHRSCGPGMVLGKDNLCYPRQVLSRRSRFRKWRQPPRPPVTSGDVKAIRRAARTRDRVKELAKDVGFKTPKRK